MFLKLPISSFYTVIKYLILQSWYFTGNTGILYTVVPELMDPDLSSLKPKGTGTAHQPHCKKKR